jgi:hypothetical protein
MMKIWAWHDDNPRVCCACRLKKVGAALQFESIMGEAELEIQAKLEEEPMPDDTAIAELMATQKPTTATTGTSISALQRARFGVGFLAVRGCVTLRCLCCTSTP